MKTQTFQVGGGGMPELCFSDNDYDRIPDCRYVAVSTFELFPVFLFLQNPIEFMHSIQAWVNVSVILPTFLKMTT